MKIEFKEEGGKVFIYVRNENSLYQVTFKDKESFLKAILTGYGNVWQAHFADESNDNPTP
jgi:hypothetical protein